MSVIKGLKGRIYVLIHPMQNGYVKIGKTERTAQIRADELKQQAGTSLAGNFIVAYEEEVENCHLIEDIAHKILQKKRVSNDREFFALTVREAIEKIREIVDKVKNQQKIDFDEIEHPIIWWGNLNFVWRRIFKKHLHLNFEPETTELIEGMNKIILYSRDEKLRCKVCEYLKNKDFQEKIKNWYNKLPISEKKEVRTYLMRNLQDEELEQIINLSELDCAGNSSIHDLNSIIPLKNIKRLNCSNTSLKDLHILYNQKLLETLDISYTFVTSLEPLDKLSHLKLVKCYHTDITEQEIQRFKDAKPNCEVLKNQSNKLIDLEIVETFDKKAKKRG